MKNKTIKSFQNQVITINKQVKLVGGLSTVEYIIIL